MGCHVIGLGWGFASPEWTLNRNKMRILWAAFPGTLISLVHNLQLPLRVPIVAENRHSIQISCLYYYLSIRGA